MRVVEKRFLRGPNIYRMAPCFAVVVDLEAHQPVPLEDLPGARGLLPEVCAAAIVDATQVARLLARLMIAMQGWAGHAQTFCDAMGATPAAPCRYRLVCGYEHEAVAEEALRMALECVTAMLTQQPFDMDARVDRLRALADASATEPATQALVQSARERGIPVLRLEDGGRCFALGWGVRKQHHHARMPAAGAAPGRSPSLDRLFGTGNDGRIPVIAVTGTNGKTTTTQLITHVLRACGVRTGSTTTQGIYIDGQCVQTGDCSGYWSARRVLTDRTVEVATLETARGGILKRGLAFDRCDVGVVLNVTGDHLGLDGVETVKDLAHVKGLVARCARTAAVLNADDAWCVSMRETLAPGCKPVLFTMDAANGVFAEHLRAGGAGACLDDEGCLVWCNADERDKIVRACDLPFTWQGHAGYNVANALAAIATLRSLGFANTAIARPLEAFVSDARSNPLRGNQFEVEGVKLIVDYAHNAVAYRALCGAARSMLTGAARLVGVVTSPGDRRPEDLNETGQVCGLGFDELVVYEQDPRGRDAGATSQEILHGARLAAPGKPLHGEPRIRQALWRGLSAARPGDVLVFTCAGSFDDLVEGVRLKSPAAADRIAFEVAVSPHAH